MTTTTKTIIEAAFAGDSTVTPEAAKAALAALADKPQDTDEGDRVRDCEHCHRRCEARNRGAIDGLAQRKNTPPC